MRTLQNNTSTILTFVFLVTFFLGQSQERTYKTQLEPVYLINAKEIVYKNTFSNYNDHLITSNGINFKKQIKISKKKNASLLFVSNKSNVELITVSYLKIIRKAANRSRNTEDFKIFLVSNLPQLANQFAIDSNLKELYFISRKDTFNGKINALPSVL